MNKILNKIKNTRQGSIALILVIMITSVTLVSALIIALISVTDLTASYHVTESKSVATNIDACIDDALSRIASSTSVSGSYNLFTNNINCTYDISTIDAGFITVTSTASSTAALGYWQDQVIVTVNVSTTPISIDTYKTSLVGYDSVNTCGDGDCTGTEDCVTCGTDCGACVCGNGGDPEGDEVCDDGNTDNEGCGNGGDPEVAGTYCNSTCTAEIVISTDEVCDDGNTFDEGCGNGIAESAGTYCNSTCTAEIVIATKEACDYTGRSCGVYGTPHNAPNTCPSKNPLCSDNCLSCTNLCPKF
jgi:hypothetical protein